MKRTFQRWLCRLFHRFWYWQGPWEEDGAGGRGSLVHCPLCRSIFSQFK